MNCLTNREVIAILTMSLKEIERGDNYQREHLPTSN